METTTTDQHQLVAESTAAHLSSFVPGEAEPVSVLEHYHRYLYASRFTKGKRVLDIASGEGYGAAFLSLNAESVIGIDADGGAVQQASQKYGECSNLRFELGQCESFKTREQSADIVVSFETLPLLPEEGRTQFMQNVVHALAPNGIFIVSTPVRSADAQRDDDKAMPGFSGVELFEFLKKHFQFVRFIGQKPLTMSAMWSLHEWKDDLFRFHVREDLLTLPSDIEMFSSPVHIIALCSDELISEDIVNNSKSLYFDTKHTERARKILAEYEEARTLVQHSQTRAAQIEGELEMHRQAVTVLTNENLTHINHIDDLQKQLDERVGRVMELEQETAGRAAKLEELQRGHDEQTIWADKLATDHEILSAKVQDAHAQLAAASEENEHLRRRIGDLQHQYQEIVSSMRSGASEIEQLKSRSLSLQTLADEKSAAATQAIEEVQRRQERIAVLEHELQSRVPSEQYAEEIGTVRARVQELEQLAAGEAEAAALAAEENRQLRSRLAEIESNAGTSDQKIAEHAEIATAMTQENQKLRGRVHELQKQFDERSAHARNTSQENEKLQSRIASIQKSIEEKSAMIILLNQEVDGYKEKMLAAHNDFEQKLHQAHQWEKENKKRIEHLNEIQRKCDEQSYTMRQMKLDFEKQTAAFDTFQKSQSDLQQRYNKSQIKVQELTQEVSILEQKFAAMKGSGAYKVLASLGLVPRA